MKSKLKIAELLARRDQGNAKAQGTKGTRARVDKIAPQVLRHRRQAERPIHSVIIVERPLPRSGPKIHPDLAVDHSESCENAKN